MNIITDAWLPVTRASGACDSIRPAQIVDAFDTDPVVGFNWGRPDLDAASRELVLGLLATACPSTDGKSWRYWWTKPPSVEQLDEAFAPFVPAFNIDGEGPLFMQDLDPLDGQDVKPIGWLPIAGVGEQTVVENADLFQGRYDVPHLSERGAAIVLFTLQLYSGYGGVGHRVSLRGRGPVTTLVSARGEASLWRLLWLNTPQQLDAKADAGLFPWMSATRTSAKNEVTTPQHVSPLTQFWGAPTRIRLVFEENAAGLRCPIAGDVGARIATGFKVQNRGASYASAWTHVLTPHYVAAPSGWLPRHGSEDILAYSHWPAFAGAPTPEHRPAEIVSIAEKRLLSLGLGGEAEIMLFAIDMNQTKARGVYEGAAPVFALPDEYAATFYGAVARLVDAAGLVSSLTRGAIRDATVGPNGDVNKGRLAGLRRRFYGDTEAAFYETLRALSAALAEASGDPTAIVQQVARDWLGVLRREALSLFDEQAPVLDLRPAAAERAAGARLWLGLMFNDTGGTGAAKKLFASLGLPLAEKGAAPAARKKAA